MITLYPSVYAKFYEKYSTVVNGELKEYTHVYVTPDGDFLPGVTGMIKRQLFPKKYGNVPEAVLAKAAERGSEIHHDCELIDKENWFVSSYALEYKSLQRSVNASPVANEYCVSLPTMASCIDCVWEIDGEVYLADIKTTYALDKEYLSWQLSIYAYMFEKQNPGLHVKGLYGVWLPKDISKSQIVTIDRKSDAEVEALIEAEVSGQQYAAVPVEKTNGIVAQSMVEEYYTMAKQVEAMNARMEQFKSFVKDKMQENGITSCDFGSFKFTLTPESESEVFDAAKFKKENPDLAKQYMKKQKRSAALRITLR